MIVSVDAEKKKVWQNVVSIHDKYSKLETKESFIILTEGIHTGIHTAYR